MAFQHISLRNSHLVLSFRYALVGIALAGALFVSLWLVPEYGFGVFLPIALGVVVLLMFAKPVIGLYILVFTIPLANVFVIGTGITWVRLIGIIVVSAWVLRKLLLKESWKAILSARILWPALIFVLFAFASLLWVDHYPRYKDEIPTIFQLLLLGLLIVGIVDSWRRLDWLIRILILSGVVASSITISEFYLQGVDRAGGSVSGGGINHTAVNLVVLIPLAFYLIRTSKSILWRLIALSYILFAPLAVALTFSRTSFIVLPIVLGIQVILMAKKSRRELLGIVMFGTITATFLTLAVPWESVLERGASISPALKGIENDPKALSGRIQFWLGAIEIFNAHPLLGVGYGNFGHQFLTFQYLVPSDFRHHEITILASPHSSILGILAELGLVGIFLWMWLHIVAFDNLRKSWSAKARFANTQHKILVQAVLISISVYLLYSLVSVTQDHKLFWLILGLTEVLRRLTRPSTKPLSADWTRNYATEKT